MANCTFCDAPLKSSERTKERVLPVEIAPRGVADDAAFTRLLYTLVLDRGLRNFPQHIRLPSGERAEWFAGWRVKLDCLFQLRSRLADLGVPFPDTAELVEEIQRVDRLLEERYAHAEGTLVKEAPLIG